MIAAVSLVLLVDDEPRIARALEFALRNTEIRMSSLSDSSQIEQSLAESRPDAILLDIQMGGDNGLDVCRRLKSDDRFGGIPVLLLSGQTSPDVKAAGFAAGADDFIAKPFVPTELIARIEAQIARAARH
jgi:two-component system phosphate regulon response regulator PhoB